MQTTRQVERLNLRTTQTSGMLMHMHLSKQKKILNHQLLRLMETIIQQIHMSRLLMSDMTERSHGL